jgi:type IV pilus assembly protein PilF
MPPLKRLLALVLLACLATTADAKKRAPETTGSISRAGQVNLGLAQSYYANGDLETALNRSMQALRTDPRSADVHAMLGLIYSRISQPAKADAEFSRALALAPNQGAILNVDGVWLCQQGRTAEADAQFSRALQDPFYKEPEQALFNAGKCAFKAGQLPKAEGLLRKSLDKAPDQPEVLLTLAKVEFAQGNYLDARAFVQRRDALGSSAEVLELAAQIEDGAGDHRAAARYRQRLQEEFPQASANSGERGKQP